MPVEKCQVAVGMPTNSTRGPLGAPAFLPASLLSCLLCTLSCSLSTGEPNKDGAGATSGPGAGGSATAPPATGGTLGAAAGGTTFVDPGIGSGAANGIGDGGLTADAACAQSVLKPEAIQVEEQHEEQIDCTAEAPSPISLYIVLDNSGSMEDNNKWGDAVDAITAFVRSTSGSGSGWTCVDKAGSPVAAPPDLPPPGAGTMSVAIQYFHPQGVGNNVDECNGAAHAQPAVPMGPIPANAPAITTSLGNTGPRGDTPTVGALTGGGNYCLAYQAQNPDVKCVVVLVTDGQPNGCGLSSDCGGGGNDCVDPISASVLTPIASQVNGRGVLTFTVGMDGITAEGFDLLDAIAIAGGSDCTPGTPGDEACNVSTTGNQGLLDALNGIRETVQVTEQSSKTFTTTVTQTTTLACEWAVPPAPTGKTFDPGLVNVSLTSGTSAPQKIGYVTSAGDCAAAVNGWYYDSEAAPTRILSCPTTCTTIENDPEMAVSVLFGCATEPVEIH